MLDVGKHPPVQVSYGPRPGPTETGTETAHERPGPLLRATWAFVLFGAAEVAGSEPARA
jgi:hypothetical protein